MIDFCQAAEESGVRPGQEVVPHGGPGAEGEVEEAEQDQGNRLTCGLYYNRATSVTTIVI